VALCIGCVPWHGTPSARWSADLPAPRLSGFDVTVDTIARGAVHRGFVTHDVPWVVHVLDIDRRACWNPVAVKPGNGAVGREKTSVVVRRVAAASPSLKARPPVAGAVNADFFLFAPPGVPQTAYVSKGVVVAGPGERPVLALDSAGRPWMGVLSVLGSATSGAESMRIDSWNRHARTGLAFFDAGYGSAVDTAAGSVRVTLAERRGGQVTGIDSSGLPTTILPRGSVLVAGRDAPRDVKERLLILARARARFAITIALVTFHPLEAVGGFPVLVRDSIVVSGLDSAGAVTFAPVRHPRTLVGVAAGGRRFMLITVDGRQVGYSAGMTLREAAQLARDLGASQAINLDGGGSTTMVVARRDPRGYRYDVVNQPSDSAGERPVGNVLAIISQCPAS
jgi:phosphodiester glycosidase